VSAWNSGESSALVPHCRRNTCGRRLTDPVLSRSPTTR